MTQIKWTRDAGVYVSDCNAFRIHKDGKTFVLREGRKIVGHGKLGELQTVAQNLRNHSFLKERPQRAVYEIIRAVGNGRQGGPVAIAMAMPAGSRRQLRKKLHALGRRDLVLASIPARS